MAGRKLGAAFGVLALAYLLVSVTQLLDEAPRWQASHGVALGEDADLCATQVELVSLDARADEVGCRAGGQAGRLPPKVSQAARTFHILPGWEQACTMEDSEDCRENRPEQSPADCREADGGYEGQVELDSSQGGDDPT
eukprot:755269-Hanusia_phi.AAC.2